MTVTDLPDSIVVGSWQRDFKIIGDELRQLSLRRTVFDRLDAEIVRTTNEAVAGLALDQFLRPIYAEAQAALIRRLVDRDERSVSLRNLLTDMMRHHEVLTRERHVREMHQRWIDSGFVGGTDAAAHESFNAFAGKDQPFVPRGQLQTLVDQIVADMRVVTTHVNKFVAHRDRVQPASMNWGQLNGALDRVSEHYSTVGLMLFPELDDNGDLLIDGLDWPAAFRDLFVT